MSRRPPIPPPKERSQLAFGAAVKQIRQGLELTQEKVAELADLHTNYVSSVERGERNISLNNIVRIAYALGVPPSHLMKCLDGGPVRHPLR